MYLATGDAPATRGCSSSRSACSRSTSLGGALIALGPGQLLIDLLIRRPSRNARHILEIVIGAALHRRRMGAVPLTADRLAERELPDLLRRGGARARCSAPRSRPSSCRPRSRTSRRSRRSSAPGSAPLRQLLLLLLFNLCFVLPLLAMIATLTFAGERAERAARRARAVPRAPLAGRARHAAADRRACSGCCSASPAWPGRATAASGASPGTSGTSSRRRIRP